MAEISSGSRSNTRWLLRVVLRVLLLRLGGGGFVWVFVVEQNAVGGPSGRRTGHCRPPEEQPYGERHQRNGDRDQNIEGGHKVSRCGLGEA